MKTYVCGASPWWSAYNLQPGSLALTFATSSLATASNSFSIPGFTLMVATIPIMLCPPPTRCGNARQRPTTQAVEKGPVARRRPKVAREAYSLYVERAAEGANEADGPLSSLSLADGVVNGDELGAV